MTADVNIFLRGQSNANRFFSQGAAAELRTQVQAILGPDFTVHLVGEPTRTTFSGTAFLDWDTDGHQRVLLDYVDGLSADLRDNPTLTLWMHNETDGGRALSATTGWPGEVRTDAGLVRGAFGQGAGTTPYLFVPVPCDGPSQDFIMDSQRALAADASFNARFDGTATRGLRMGWFGAELVDHHWVGDDASVVADRLAEPIAAILDDFGTGDGGPAGPSAGNDALTGTAAGEAIDALAGDDTVDGLGGDDTLRGGEGTDSLLGGDGNDSLDGGAGADRMAGGAGDDTYVVDTAGETVTEARGAGTDRVLSAVTLTLAADVEDLALTGAAALAGTGNGLANRLVGNAGANRLDGRAGADALEGGAGDDRYVVDNAGDVVAEAAGEGTADQVQSKVTFALGTEVETLTLTGTAAADGTGNAPANRLVGNAGANLLRGLDARDTLQGGDGADTLVGGADADVLTGGAGADVFRYDLLGEKGDRIADFVAADDAIEVSRAGFGGALAVGEPVTLSYGTASGAGVAQFVYVSATGALRWDADGAGGAGAQTLATLTGAPAITAADIAVIA
jgi:Ca2+-binding RTX toxin-like protein